MERIFHVALAADWATAQEAGDYRISTLGRTLEQEGFIHASRADQWPGVRERFYAGVTEPLVLLVGLAPVAVVASSAAAAGPSRVAVSARLRVVAASAPAGPSRPGGATVATAGRSK